MELTERDLLRYKKEIEEAKSELSEARGKEKQLLKQLKSDWGCANLEEAKKKIREMESDRDRLKEEIEESTQELVDNYFTEEDD